MNLEFAILKTLSEALPPIRGAGAIGNLIRKFYARKERTVQESNVLDFRMLLDPCECVDGGLLFYPRLYDRREIDFLRTTLQEGDTFIDVGANIGFYSLVASKLVGASGQVVSVEADPEIASRLKKHLGDNGCHNAQVFQLGISDRYETLKLSINQHGNRGGSSFLTSSTKCVEVDCLPLAAFLKSTLGEQPPKRLIMKMDIEGMEFRVMSQFLLEAEKRIWPKFLIIEDNSHLYQAAGGKIIDLLLAYGYQIHTRCSAINVILALNSR